MSTLIDLDNPETTDDEAMEAIKKRANRAWATVRRVASLFNSDPTDDDDINDLDVLAVAEEEAQRFEVLAALAEKVRAANAEQIAAMHKNVQAGFTLGMTPANRRESKNEQRRPKTNDDSARTKSDDDKSSGGDKRAKLNDKPDDADSKSAGKGGLFKRFNVN